MASETILQSQVDLTYKTDSFVEFPYHKMIPATWNAAEKVFRFFVDGTNGNDANDGKLWATAKKTFAGAIGELPPDLFGHKAYILVMPGTYPEQINLAGVNNGQVFLWPAGTDYNAPVGDPNYDPFVNPDGHADLVAADDPVIVAPTTGACLWGGWSSQTALRLNVRSSYGPYNSSCKLMWGRWIFKKNNTFDYAVALWNLQEVFFENLVVDMSLSTSGLGAISITSDNGNVYYHSLGVVGTTAAMANSNSSSFDWASAIVIGSKFGVTATQRYWWGNSNVATNFKSTHLPPQSKKIHVEGFYQIFSPVGVWGGGNLFDPYSLSWVQGHVDKGAKPRIRLNNDWSGQLVYKSAEADLLDNSIVPHIVKDETAPAITKFMISPKTREDGNYHVTKVPTTAIADASLNVGEASFWLDEATGKLKVKAKKTNGTVMNGEVTLT